MIVILNGPLGIGKSTLAEALTERIEFCVMLDGDHLIAVNPAPADELDYLQRTIAILVGHHLSSGYRHFVINHFWRTGEQLAATRRCLLEVDASFDIHSFLLTLPPEENYRRIERRQEARAIDEREFEWSTVHEERQVLYRCGNSGLGEPFEVSATPDELAAKLQDQLGL